MKPEKEMMRDFTMLLISTLEYRDKVKLEKFWGEKKEPYIFTSEEQIDGMSDYVGHLDYAATNGIGIFFKLDNIKKDGYSLTRITYHEIAHCLLFARGEFSMLDYQENHTAKMRKCERRAQRLEADYLAKLAKDKVLLGRLRAHSAVLAWVGNQSLEPI